MKKAFILLLFCVISATPLMAQTIDIDCNPGAVSVEELKMDCYPLDTTASALVLCKSRHVKVTLDYLMNPSLTATVYKRYKVLKEEGRDCADFSFIHHSKRSFGEKISDIKVVTYNLDGGQVVPSEMSSDLLYKHAFTGSFDRTAFSAPDVRVGSVVEVQYTISYKDGGNVGRVFMQEQYPVNHGTITIEYPQFLQYNKRLSDNPPFAEVNNDFDTYFTYLDGIHRKFTAVKDIYVAYDVPAFKVDPICYYPYQSCMRVEYDLVRIDIPGGMQKTFPRTWEEFDNDFVRAGLLLMFKSKHKLVKKIAAEVKGITDEEELIKAVRNRVLSTVKWNKGMGILANTDYACIYKEGDASDICAVVGSVLNRVGYSCSPVFIKTRDKGIIEVSEIFGSLFNVLILQIITPSGKIYYTDVVSDNAYLNVLPNTYLVSNARLLSISDKRGRWVDLTRISESSDAYDVVASLDTSGSIEGECIVVSDNESAMNLKIDYDRRKNEEVFSYGLVDVADVEVSEFEFPEHDAWSSRASYHFKFSTEAELTGDYIYVNPFLRRFYSGFYLDEERLSQLDIPFAETVKYSYKLTFPSGYDVEILPQDQDFSFGHAKSRATVRYERVNENEMRMDFVLIFDTYSVQPEEYREFLVYLMDILKIYDTAIVLRKK